jgi:hypothetical protein
MIKLEITFTSGVGGFSGPDVLTYKQIVRCDTAAIYERSRDGKVKDFEVIKIKIVPKGTSIFNAPPSLDDEEAYPSTGQWGKSGFSYRNLGAAEKKYAELVQKISDAADEDGAEPSVSSSITIPVKDFTTTELAEQNHIQYTEAVKFINESITKGSVKFVKMERRNAKGKESKIYAKV